MTCARVIVLDSLGLGAAPDAPRFGDAGAFRRCPAGVGGRYRRTANRHDHTTPPPAPLDVLAGAGREMRGVGKIRDIVAARGTTHHRAGDGDSELCEQTLAAWQACAGGGLVFSNLVDFDMLCGHCRDVAGCADALEAFDLFSPQVPAELRPGDVLALSADHGCDPSWPGSDHTREHVPLLFAGSASPRGLAEPACARDSPTWARRWPPTLPCRCWRTAAPAGEKG